MRARTGLSLKKKYDASPEGLLLGLIVCEGSRPDGHRNRWLRRRGRSALLSRTADLTHTGAGFQERDFPAGQAAVMNKVLAQGATRPAAAEKCFVAIEFFLADLTGAGFNPQQHRLPRPCSVSNTHGTEYSERVRVRQGPPSRQEKAGQLSLGGRLPTWGRICALPSYHTGGRSR